MDGGTYGQMSIWTPTLQTLIPSVFWKGKNSTLHLTYDDGPHPATTPILLEVLRSYDIKTTFFFLGHQAQQFPDLVRQAHAEGHVIGNHSFDHPSLIFRSPQFIAGQIDRTTDCIRHITGSATMLFRPPYGYFGPTLLRTAARRRHRLVLWSLDSEDWRRGTSAEISQRICRKARPGSIILLHENEHTVSKAADILKRTIDTLLSSFSFAAIHS